MDDITIVLGEDHLITRQGIRRLLEDEPGFTIQGEGSNGEEVVELVTELKPDVVLMDIAMPKLNGIEATRQIKLINPRTGVLILSAYDDDEYVFGLLKAGAAGYLLKNVSGDELIKAIKNKPKLVVISHFSFWMLRANVCALARIIQDETGVKTRPAEDFMQIDLDTLDVKKLKEK